VVVPYGEMAVSESLFTKAGVPEGAVCPMPDAWHKLFQIIKPHETPSSRLKNPLILGGWDTPSEMKLERFEEHLPVGLAFLISVTVSIIGPTPIFLTYHAPIVASLLGRVAPRFDKIT
jgi:hypothetical protein